MTLERLDWDGVKLIEPPKNVKEMLDIRINEHDVVGHTDDDAARVELYFRYPPEEREHAIYRTGEAAVKIMNGRGLLELVHGGQFRRVTVLEPGSEAVIPENTHYAIHAAARADGGEPLDFIMFNRPEFDKSGATKEILDDIEPFRPHWLNPEDLAVFKVLRQVIAGHLEPDDVQRLLEMDNTHEMTNYVYDRLLHIGVNPDRYLIARLSGQEAS